MDLFGKKIKLYAIEWIGGYARVMLDWEYITGAKRIKKLVFGCLLACLLVCLTGWKQAYLFFLSLLPPPQTCVRTGSEPDTAGLRCTYSSPYMREDGRGRGRCLMDGVGYQVFLSGEMRI